MELLGFLQIILYVSLLILIPWIGIWIIMWFSEKKFPLNTLENYRTGDIYFFVLQNVKKSVISYDSFYGGL